MEHLFSKFAEIIKLKPLNWLVMWLTCSALLFLPKTTLAALGLKTFVQEQNGWVGFAFLVTLMALIGTSGEQIYEFAKERLHHKKQVKGFIEALGRLTPVEKTVLKQFMDREQASMMLPLNNSTVVGLEAQGLIFKRGNAMGTIFEFPFMLQPCIWFHLKDHPELLDGAASSVPQ